MTIARRFFELGLLGTVACTTDATQLVAVIDSDLAVPSELTRARVAYRVGGKLVNETTFPLVSASSTPPPGSYVLPLSFGIVPTEDPEAEISLTAEAIGPSNVLFSRLVETHFIEGESRLLPLFLASRCVTEVCAEGETCTESGCASPKVDPAKLAEVTAGEELSKVPDAGWSRPDGGTEDGGDSDAAIVGDPEARLTPAPPYELNQLSANPNRPEIFLGQAVTHLSTLSNVGSGALVISKLEITGDIRSSFSLDNAPNLPLELPAGQDLTVRVKYAPLATGADTAQLVIGTNDDDIGSGTGEITAELRGTTTNCPEAEFSMPGARANEAGRCQYTCVTGHYDIDQAPGCEYACTIQRNTEDPDDNFADENCDGVDGNAATSLFVAPPPLGDDAADGSRFSPLASVSEALSRASSGTSILVSRGEYAESLELVSGVSIYGGYDASDRWVRSAASQPVIMGLGTAIRAASLTSPVVLDRLTVRSASVAAGAPTIGLWVVDSNLEVRSSSVSAGAGGPGDVGATGEAGVAGGAGGAGGTGVSGGTGGGGPGAPGVSACDPATEGSPGGTGGSDNASGTPGEPLGVLAGGPGGAGAQGCNSSACAASCVSGRTRGEVGQPGAVGDTPGGNGTPGPGAQSIGGLSGDEWLTPSGGLGTDGTFGSGGSGGGGGGGGADECFVRILGDCHSQNVCSEDQGGGGGGGGGGGCGGKGGGGGQGGGASIGVLMVRSTVVLDRTTVSASRGGPGGAGGAGGSSGAGGAGGAGGEGRDDSGAGGPGGAGAPGGAGGEGGGGAGGSSWCVVVDPTSSLVENQQVYEEGLPGSGGDGSNPGVDGEAGTVLRL